MSRFKEPRSFRRHRRTVSVALVATGMLVTAACGGSESTAPSDAAANPVLTEIFGAGGKAAGGELKINTGLLTAVTGQGSYYGEVMSQGAKLAAEQIAAQGGPKITVSVADHESGLTPVGVAATRKLITQDKIALLQTSYGAVSEAIAPLLSQSKVLGFQGGGASPGQLNKPFLWMTMSVFGDDSAAGGLSYVARTFPEAKRLVVVGTRENGRNASENIVPAIWPKIVSGGQVVGTEMHDVGITDFGPVVSRIKAADPDAIYSTDFGNDTGYLVKALRQAGLDIPVVISEFTTQACEIAGDAFDKVFLAGDYFDPTSSNPFTKQFVKSYEKAYGSEPDFYAANYYEEMFVYWTLVRRVLADGGDPMSSAELEKQLEAGDEFPSLYGGGTGEVGSMTFNATDHTVNKPMGVFEVANCTPKKVADIQKVDTGSDPTSSLIK